MQSVYEPALSSPASNYNILSMMEKAYDTPWHLVGDFAIPASKKTERLSCWYHDRTKFLFEYGHDLDFVSDKILHELEKALDFLKGIKDAVETPVPDTRPEHGMILMLC